MPWSVLDLPKATPLKNVPLTSPGIFQFPIAPQLGVGFHDHLQDPMLEFCLALAYTGLEHAATTTLSLYVQPTL